jgi:hypothetical protein
MSTAVAASRGKTIIPGSNGPLKGSEEGGSAEVGLYIGSLQEVQAKGGPRERDETSRWSPR